MIRYLTLLLALICIGLPGVAKAACTSPSGAAGDIVYNTSEKYFQYCNDTNWVAMNAKPGSGAGGCTNPTLDEGQMAYNADNRVLQGCAGNIHVAMGPLGGANQWLQISMAVQAHGCGIKHDGSLWCWGNNMNGRIGDGTTTVRAVPTPVSGGGSWKQVSAGFNTCAIKSDDTLWCWGSNAFGRTGLNTTVGNALTPTQVSGGGTWKSVATGGASCGIKSDDTLWCWGPNTNGITGLNTTVGNTLVPTQVAVGTTWKFIATGSGSACAIKSDDTLNCWGSNNYGVTGRNTSAGNTLVPTGVSGGGSWKHVDVGSLHSCGIKSDNSGHCWGYNLDGRTGRNTTAGNTLVPSAISGGGSWKSIDAGTSHTCGIKSDDTVNCWGNNYWGEVGDGTLVDKLVPTALTAGGTWSSVIASAGATCAITINSKMLKCWGSNYDGIRADNYPDQTANSPKKVSGTETWNSLALGSMGWGLDFTCGLKNDNSVWCWGYNDEGALGSTVPLTQITINKVQVSGAHNFVDIEAGAAHICGLKADGSVMCWGMNSDNELGNGNTTSTNTPGALSGGHSFTKISARGFHGCGIKADKSMWCWGANWSGQLGDNTWDNRSAPVQVTGGYQWDEVATGVNNTCGIRTDGVLMCWGDWAATGDGTWNDYPYPVTVSGGYKWQSVSVGDYHACGITTAGLAMCWGADWYGQLGTGELNDYPYPVPVLGGHTYKTISAGEYISCGIRADDTLWCWGDNDEGQLGNGTSGTSAWSDVPVQVAGGGSWKTVEASYYHTCAMNKNNEPYCWGMVDYGGIGDGKTGFGIAPVDTYCGGPTGKAGAIAYNSSETVLQYCDGTGWVGMTGSGTPGASDPCAGSPAPGTVCDDGSLYAGLSPDGNMKMFTLRCDHGQSWNGSTCIGSRSYHAWSDSFSAGYTDTTITNCATSGICNALGESNAAILMATDADPGTGGFQYHDAANICDTTNENGQTDWYLPSIPELAVLYSNRTLIGGFDSASSYWTSSEVDANNAWSVPFNTGTPVQNDKTSITHIRCVRK